MGWMVSQQQLRSCELPPCVTTLSHYCQQTPPVLQVLGRALATLPRDQIVVASKTGQYAQHGFDFSAQKTYDSVKLSLERLQVPYLDLLQCHDVEYVDIDQVCSPLCPCRSAVA